MEFTYFRNNGFPEIVYGEQYPQYQLTGAGDFGNNGYWNDTQYQFRNISPTFLPETNPTVAQFDKLHQPQFTQYSCALRQKRRELQIQINEIEKRLQLCKLELERRASFGYAYYQQAKQPKLRNSTSTNLNVKEPEPERFFGSPTKQQASTSTSESTSLIPKPPPPPPMNQAAENSTAPNPPSSSPTPSIKLPLLQEATKPSNPTNQSEPNFLADIQRFDRSSLKQVDKKEKETKPKNNDLVNVLQRRFKAFNGTDAKVDLENNREWDGEHD